MISAVIAIAFMTAVFFMSKHTLNPRIDVMDTMAHVETVVLLSQQKPDDQIEVDLVFSNGKTGKTTFTTNRENDRIGSELQKQKTKGGGTVWELT